MAKQAKKEAPEAKADKGGKNAGQGKDEKKWTSPPSPRAWGGDHSIAGFIPAALLFVLGIAVLIFSSRSPHQREFLVPLGLGGMVLGIVVGVITARRYK